MIKFTDEVSRRSELVKESWDHAGLVILDEATEVQACAAEMLNYLEVRFTRHSFFASR